MTALLLTIAAVAIVLACVLDSARRDALAMAVEYHNKHNAAVEHMHAIANSALRGCPAVKWHRPYPVPAGADAWYWRVMIDGEPHLFTDEARTEARRRANNLLPSCRVVQLSPAKRDKPRPDGEIFQQ